MDINKRKEYFILTTVVWGVGFLLYGIMAIMGRETLKLSLNVFQILLLYGIGGGMLTGGLVSGIILFSHFIKKRKLSFKIIACIFFPLTFMIICEVGVVSFLPYAIYNLIIIKRSGETLGSGDNDEKE